jgi:hypothetical protein
MKVNAESPISKISPGLKTLEATRSPAIMIPLALPRSSIIQEPF